MPSESFPSALNRLRRLSGMTQARLARAANLSEAAVSRYARGVSTPDISYVQRLDDAVGADGELVAAWRQQTSRDALPVFMRSVSRLEEEAVAIDALSPLILPGYVQHPDYARHVISDGQPLLEAQEITRWVEARCARFDDLTGHHHLGSMTVLFPVAALDCVPEDVAARQVEHLRSLSGVAVHVLPPGRYLPGLTSPTQLYRLRDSTAVAVTEHLAGNVILGADDIPRLEALYRRALAASLPQPESFELLERYRQ
ncbi:Scr1 family TA system antitoxin-like transcriptional regulator [Nocardiopsis chromatogenes]|uniref:Scr1 family TA system antitoxin-like transcriptional regulator n=1 Tax=Nocardiopsis chromatogenes TaxID=280239 RepID=UPI0003683513|nr:Scr1 family TA system antitoxin-like transcriptional regulator [Nocardiopsis chromatogenes]